ncbi:MAG: hypothetical protein GY703_17105 [Gammaproteobacteria bacterium]|nr:hypothetical protein [Gammaproteobacteria bacterium]
MKRLAVTFTLILALAVLAGCTTTQPRYQEPEDVDLIQMSFDATAKLIKLSRKPLPIDSMVVVSTFVNVDELGQTASFGRIVSAQIASAFNRAGYRIRAMELPTDLFIREESGMVHLSDETKRVLRANDASALIVGVFAPGRRTAYVSIRMVDIASETVISTADFSVPMGPDAKVLLKPRPTGSSKP